MEKQCIKCNETKLISEFHKNKTGKYGVLGTCKLCQKEIMKNWQLNNLEHHKKIIKKWDYKISGVYGIYNNNTLLYIGQSKQLNGRITRHKNLIKNPSKAPADRQPFYYTLNQHKSVYFTTIEECSPTTLLEREAHYITQLKPLLNKHKNEN